MKQIPNYTLLQFQEENVKQMVQSIAVNNAAVCFDQTGLGKTITGATCAYNLYTENSKILVVSATNTHPEWNRVLSAAGVNFSVCTRQKLSEGSYDIFILDEVHNYQTINSKQFKDMFIKIKQNNPKVIALTATPFQNQTSNLSTWISLLNFSKNSTPRIVLPKLFHDAELLEEAYKKERVNSVKDRKIHINTFDKLTALIENDKRKIYAKVKADYLSEQLFVKRNGAMHGTYYNIARVIKLFSVFNSWESVEKDYAQDVVSLGCFPKTEFIKLPVCNDCGYYVYDILDDKLTYAYQNKEQFASKGCDFPYSKLYKVMLLKLMDSSMAAFKESLNKFISNVENELELSDEDLLGQITTNYGFDIDVKSYKKDLLIDLKLLQEISKQISNVNDDTKIKLLLNSIDKNHKTVIFTEYEASFQLIKSHLEANKIKFTTFSKDTTEKEMEIIDKDFNANNQKTNKFDVILCTDAAAEGVNLHAANTLIHFDQTWNPSAMVQRNGRIKRIVKNGKERTIYIKTFEQGETINKAILLDMKIDFKQSLSDYILNNNIKPITFFDEAKLPEIPTEPTIRYYEATVDNDDQYKLMLPNTCFDNSLQSEYGTYYINRVLYSKISPMEDVVQHIKLIKTNNGVIMLCDCLSGLYNSKNNIICQKNTTLLRYTTFCSADDLQNVDNLYKNANNPLQNTYDFKYIQAKEYEEYVGYYNVQRNFANKTHCIVTDCYEHNSVTSLSIEETEKCGYIFLNEDRNKRKTYTIANIGNEKIKHLSIQFLKQK